MRQSIRFRLLASIVAVNLLGGIVTMVYLHQSYSGGVAEDAVNQLKQSQATWSSIQKLGRAQLGNLTDPKAADAYLTELKSDTGGDFAVLIDKKLLDKVAYAKAREAANLPNNYDEGTTYVQVALTKQDWAKEFQFNPTPESVPEIGKLVGVKNGACSKLCHGSVKGSGDYWGVTWSDELGVTEAHGVFPITQDGKVIGVIYSIKNFSAQADSARSAMIRTLIVISITLAAATILIGMMIDIWVFRRLNRMTLAIEDLSVRVAGGDFNAHFEPDGTTDEIGEFESFFARFMDLISATLKALAGSD